MAVGDLVVLLAHPVDDLGHVLRRDAGSRHECHRHVGDAAEMIEVVDHVVLQGRIKRGRSRVRDVPDRDDVSVGRRGRHPRHADRAAGAADIFDDNGLPERAAHGFRDQPRDRIGRATCGRRHHQRDGSRRVALWAAAICGENAKAATAPTARARRLKRMGSSSFKIFLGRLHVLTAPDPLCTWASISRLRLRRIEACVRGSIHPGLYKIMI